MKDSLTLFRTLSPSKVINATKVFLSFHISRLLQKPVLWGRPVALSVEPTTSCNLRCPECPSGLRSFSRPTGMLDRKFFENAIDELQNHLLYLTFYFQGEPFLNPDFLEMVQYASAKGIYTATSTNAHYLDDESAR